MSGSAKSASAAPPIAASEPSGAANGARDSDFDNAGAPDAADRPIAVSPPAAVESAATGENSNPVATAATVASPNPSQSSGAVSSSTHQARDESPGVGALGTGTTRGAAAGSSAVAVMPASHRDAIVE